MSKRLVYITLLAVIKFINTFIKRFNEKTRKKIEVDFQRLCKIRSNPAGPIIRNLKNHNAF